MHNAVLPFRQGGKLHFEYAGRKLLNLVEIQQLAYLHTTLHPGITRRCNLQLPASIADEHLHQGELPRICCWAETEVAHVRLHSRSGLTFEVEVQLLRGYELVVRSRARHPDHHGFLRPTLRDLVQDIPPGLRQGQCARQELDQSTFPEIVNARPMRTEHVVRINNPQLGIHSRSHHLRDHGLTHPGFFQLAYCVDVDHKGIALGLDLADDQLVTETLLR